MLSRVLEDDRGRNTPAPSPWSDWREPLVWFWTTLCGDGPGWVEIRFRDPKTNRFTSSFHDARRPIAALNRSMEMAEAGDVFVGMCIRGRRRGTAQDVIRASLLWADLDEGETGLSRVPLQPNLLQDSGTRGHVHCYWSLSEPADLTDPVERREFQSTLRGIQKASGSDNVSDLPRIMRPPGTLNWKDPEEPVVVAPVDFKPL